VKRTLQFAVAIGISALCVWLSMKEVDLARVAESLRNANYLGFAAVMAITIFAFWVRAIRWRLLLRADRRIPTGSLFSATMIGFMANNVLPFRLGEFVRPWALARREKLSKTMTLATIVVERAIDMLTLLAIFGIALIVSPIAENTPAGRLVQGGARVLLVLSVGLTVFVVAAERNRRLARALLGVLPPRFRDRAGRLLDRFLDGFALFRDVGRLLQVFVLSFGMFLSFAVALWITGWSLDIPLPWYAGLVMLVVTAIGIMVPAAPGYVGTLNVACTAGLALYGIGKTPASAYGWFYFFSQWLPITAVGLWFLNREGLSLHSLGQVQDEGT
jgi:uncharacterized protein (TIRG00374 family)